VPHLLDGFDLVVVGMGLFGIAEVLSRIGERRALRAAGGAIGRLLPDRDEWRRCIAAALRGTGLGFLVGTLPGGGAVVISFLA
jgi:putative tricarboxylic transport membrane protein